MRNAKGELQRVINIFWQSTICNLQFAILITPRSLCGALLDPRCMLVGQDFRDQRDRALGGAELGLDEGLGALAECACEFGLFEAASDERL
jgi:hypothetical protein